MRQEKEEHMIYRVPWINIPANEFVHEVTQANKQ